jgi:hypothetical protein
MRIPQFYRAMEDGMRRWQHFTGKTKFVPFGKAQSTKAKRQKSNENQLVVPLAINQIFAAVAASGVDQTKTIHLRKLTTLKTLPPWEDTEYEVTNYRCSKMWLDEFWFVDGTTLVALDCTRKQVKTKLELADCADIAGFVITSLSVTANFVAICIRRKGVLLFKREKKGGTIEEILLQQENMELDVFSIDMHLLALCAGTAEGIKIFEIGRTNDNELYFMNLIYEEQFFYNYKLASGAEVPMEISPILGTFRRGSQIAAFTKNAFVMKDYSPEKKIACVYNDLGTLSCMTAFGELFAVANVEGQAMITEFASGKAHYVKNEFGVLSRDPRSPDKNVPFPINRQMIAISPNVLYVLLPNGTLCFASHTAFH